VELDDDAEEAGPGPPRRPVQLRLVLRIRPHQLPVGGDDVHRQHALAGDAEGPAVPAVAPLHQVAAERHPLAVPAGEEEALLVEHRAQLVAAHAGAGDGGGGLPVDVHAVEWSDVEQHPPVAQRVVGEAVAAGADRDLPSLRGGQPHGFGHVLRVLGANDGVGVALRQAGVGARVAAGVLVPVLAAAEELAGDRHPGAIRLGRRS
jgi:hypothetical protein